MAGQSPQIVIVIPTYNESENLPRMVAALFDLNIEGLNILVVDDNSPDGTGELAEQLRDRYDQRVSVLHRQEKNGLGPAYVAGFKFALTHGADIIIQMDADFSHQPKYVPDLLKAIENADVVLGSRYVRGGSVDEGWGVIRKLLSWFANRIYTPILLGIPVYDSTAGFRVWRHETLVGMNLDRVHSNGYVFQVEMAYIAHRLGYKIDEVPIHFPDRQHGQSKMKPNIAIEAAMRVFEIRARNRKLAPESRRTQEYS